MVFNISFYLSFGAFLVRHEKIVFHLLMPLSVYLVIITVALVPDSAIFENIFSENWSLLYG